MPRRLRVVVMDDEPLARRRLERLIAAHPDLEWVASHANPRQAGDSLRDVDLLFLDIEMPFENGFAWLDRLSLRDACAVVIVTAHERHALPAIRREAVDFLLKPYDDVSFGLAVARARRGVAAAALTPLPPTPVSRGSARPLAVGTPGRERWLDPATIAWVQAAGKQVRIRHGDTTLVQAGSLAAFERRLADAGFVRVHRGCLVNLTHVTGRRARAHGDGWLMLRDGSELPLSRRYADAVAARLR
jgi:two-component system, LytTR family, response regulator